MDGDDAKRQLNAVAEEIERAAVGIGSWKNVVQRLADGFPGSSCVILSEDTLHKTLKHHEVVNVEPHHMKAYAEHFAFCNPWLQVWSHNPGRFCVVSERDFPVSLINKTEFYNDFVRQIPGFDASTGLSLDIEPSTTFRMPLHYPVGLAEQYDPWAEWIMSRLKGVLRRTANGLLEKEGKVDLDIAHAALAGRPNELAFVVDDRMTLQQANPQGEKALRSRTVVTARQGKLTFDERTLATTVPAAVASLASSAASEVASITAQVESGLWVFHFSLVAGSRSNPLISTRPLVLIQARNLSEVPTQQPLSEFAKLFRLTRSEELFCRHLMTGSSVRDIAVATGITFETARFRLRSIFQKTSVHRQGELVSLLHRFAIG